MKKVLYFDVETTGLDPQTDFIMQLSGLVEVDGEIVEEFNYFLQPPKGTAVSKEALKVTGKTIDDLRSYPPAQEGFDKFNELLNKYVLFDRWSEKFYPSAYNGNFDLQFVDQMFKRQFKTDRWGYYQNWQLIDPLPVFRTLTYAGLLNTYGHKLSTMCDHFGISLEAHDALSDVRATRDLVQLLKNGLRLDLWSDGPVEN
jgi:DNA polymerase-3 subunit epsilon